MRLNIQRKGPWLIGALIVLILVAAIFFAVRKPPLEVDIGEVTAGPMTVTIDDEGETRVKDLYVIAAPINGRLERIELDAGDEVDAGQSVVVRMTPVSPDFLDDRTARSLRADVAALDSSLNAAIRRVERAEASARLASVEHQRVAAIAERGFASRATLDRSTAALEETRAALAEAKAAAAAARSSRNAARALLTPPSAPGAARRLTITSPVSGRIMRLPQESETIVRAGTPLVEIGDPATLEIVTDLLSADAVRVEEGDEVLIEDWGGEGDLRGRVQRVEPFGFTKISALGVEEQRVNVIIDLADRPERWRELGHGYRVSVRIVDWSGEEVTRLPISSLFREKGEWAVFVVDGGRAHLTPVSIGRINDEYAELREGLVAGATVILHPSEKIVDKRRVTRRD